MKKLICAVWISLFWIGTALAVSVPEDVAKQVAANWLTERTGQLVTPDDAASVFPTAGENGQTTYFSVAFAPEGWVIVAADDVAYPVIGYSPTGHFQPVSEQRPPSFSGWMAGVEADIAAAVRRRSSPLPETFLAWERLAVSTSEFRPLFSRNTRGDPVAGPLIQTQWGQGTYYNSDAPYDDSGPDDHAVTGCVATAMAQLMRYHGHPSTGVGSHSYYHDGYDLDLSADFGASTYDWNDIPSSGAIETSNPAVAKLMYHAGVSVEMDFGPGGSSAALPDVEPALRDYFRYTSKFFAKREDFSAPEEWIQLLKADIGAGRPVLYAGQNSAGTAGHAFICDGYDNSSPTFFHFNWGWDGFYNGYFLLTDLTPGSYEYNHEHEAIFGIEPAPGPSTFVFPYTEGFEGGQPEGWDFWGQYAVISGSDAFSGTSSLLLGSPTDAGAEGAAVLKLAVPSGGLGLEFYAKRDYVDGPLGEYGGQAVTIRREFGTSVLETVFSDDFTDSDWKFFELDLSPYAGETISVYFEQTNKTSNFREWMRIDDIRIEGPAAPEVQILFSGTLISSGDASPSPGKGTDFGEVEIGGELSRSFTIENVGTATLHLSSAVLSGSHAGDFSITQAPASSVPADGTTSLEISFSPTAEGIRTATFQIDTNDTDENPYVFDLQGTGGTVASPEIEVRGNGVEIVSGDAGPSAADGTDLETVQLADAPFSADFTIHNLGASSLTISGVSFGGAHAQDLTLSTAPDSTLPALGQTGFSIGWIPGGKGVRTAEVTVSSNDADESAYTFAVQLELLTGGDLDGDLDVDLTDGIRGLQVLTGTDSVSVDVDGDVDGNTRLGLPEVIYILRKVSGN